MDNGLTKQRYSKDKCGFGLSKFDKSSKSHIIFVKATRNKFNNMETKKVHDVIYPKRYYVRNNLYVYERNHVFISTCSYCNTKGHTPNVCYIRNYDVPYGDYVWVRKITNPRGSK